MQWCTCCRCGVIRWTRRKLVDVGRSYFTSTNMLHSILRILRLEQFCLFTFSSSRKGQVSNFYELHWCIPIIPIILPGTNWFAFSLVCINFTLPVVFVSQLTTKNILNIVYFDLFIFQKELLYERRKSWELVWSIIKYLLC